MIVYTKGFSRYDYEKIRKKKSEYWIYGNDNDSINVSSALMYI